ncbi:MAG: hypothetical protein JSS05_07925 [Proteobacteria bacterium]|nr:hypothetical protein [Pseudomonadota bacterium]
MPIDNGLAAYFPWKSTFGEFAPQALYERHLQKKLHDRRRRFPVNPVRARACAVSATASLLKFVAAHW